MNVAKFEYLFECYSLEKYVSASSWGPKNFRFGSLLHVLLMRFELFKVNALENAALSRNYVISSHLES